MIKFEEIVIKGFKNPDRTVSAKFSSEKISVIFGENGSGKTTFLKIIHAVLDKDEDILLREKVNSINIIYSDNDERKKIVISLKKEVHNHLSEKERPKYNWKEFDNSSLAKGSSILFGVNRGITNRLDIDYYDVYKFISTSYREEFSSSKIAMNFSKELIRFLREQNLNNKRENRIHNRNINFEIKNLKVDDINIETIQYTIQKRYRVAKVLTSHRVQKALFDTLSSAINPVKDGLKTELAIEEKDFLEQLSKHKEKLLEALKESAENTLRDELITILNNKDLEKIMQYCFKSDLLKDLLYRMMQELEHDGNILESINVLEEIFNHHISNDKKIVITTDEVYIKLGEERHGLNELSSGERHLLTFLTLFLIEGKDKNFLMIDEPELSLNIKWQRELLPLLNELSPNAQIIVASHSPSIAKKNTNYLVKLSDGVK